MMRYARLLMFVGLLALAGCSWVVQPPGGGEPPSPPEPSPPEREPLLGILMEGEQLPPGFWEPLPYGHFYEGQYITLFLVAENIEVELVEWWIWPDDRPDVQRHYEGTSFRDYFFGTGCGDPAPRLHHVLCRVTDSAGELHDLFDQFWIHKYHGD